MNSYWHITRTATYSILFAVPLLLMYELGALFLAEGGHSTLRNGADVLLRSLLAAGGVEGTIPFTLFLLGAGVVIVLLEQRRRRVRVRAAPFLGMAMESLAYALVFGAVIGGLTHWLLQTAGLRLALDGSPLAALSREEGIVLSLGAGVYEEIVFRVLLVGGFYAVFRGSGLERRRSAIFSALLAALIFSAFHYVGPYGDPWQLPSFLFRFLAGLAFSVLFLLRGFGITAWTHALYDVLIFTFRGS
jgi:hypothetical protein